MEISNLEQASLILRDYMPQIQSTDWNFALADMQALMAELGNPQDKIKVIHVAGTSGKTSTCYYLAKMLALSGKTVGLTVSPHVDEINERMQINGQPLAEAEFCKLLTEFLGLPAVTKHRPSYFGLLAAFAYWVFDRKQLDYAVIEVGLGGRLDATNVVSRPDKVAVITDIGLDHVAMLGNDVVTIAGEKAGIIKPGNQVFTNQQASEIIDVFKKHSQKQHAQLQVVESGDAPSQLPLFQRRNWALAKSVVDYVARRDGFELTKPEDSANIIIPARMEIISSHGKTLVFDGAHNVQKITALCESLKQRFPDQKLAAMVSFTSDKEIMDQKMALLREVIDDLIITTFRVEQDMAKWSIEPAEMAKAARAVGFATVQVIDEPAQALQALLDRPEPIVLVTGSFYLLNCIRPLIEELHHD